MARLITITAISSTFFFLTILLPANAQSAPSASFTVNVTEGNAPLTVQFTDLSTVSPAAWQWNFDDGSPNATTQDVSHTFSQVGIYDVILNVRSASGSSTYCKRIVVNSSESLRLFASGTKITYQNGTAAVLSGTAICPYSAIEGSHLTPGQIDATIKEMKNMWNMSAVRLVVFPQHWGPSFTLNGGYPSGAAMYDLDHFITACMRNGMYALIDWHNYGDTDCYNITNPGVYDPCLQFWQNASKLYGNLSMVMFEIYNEPGWYPWSAWQPLAQNLVQTIRQNSSNIIIVGGVRMSYYAIGALNQPIIDTNTIYNTHCYNDSAEYSGSWDSVLAPVAAKYPAFMTEWGTYNMSYLVPGGSSVHNYLHGIVWFMKNNGYDGTFAWNWDPTLGGTPLVNSINPPFTYTDWGKYVRNVTLGNMPPYANISVSGNKLVGGMIQLNDTLGWGVTSWDWNYGDGSPHGITRNVTHVYSTPGNYTVVLTATNPNYTNISIGPDVSTVAITVSAPPTPVLNFGSNQYRVRENASIITIPVTMSNNISFPVSVNYSVIGGNATMGTDYTGGNGTLKISPGATTASFEVSIMNNAIYRGNRTIVLGLSDPKNATIAAPSTTTITIIEDDAPQVTIYNLSLVEGWNLVSLPLVPQNNSITSLFPANVSGGIVDIWGWDEAAQNWMYYSSDPLDYFNQYYPAITKLETGRAYWMEMNKSANVTVQGTVPYSAPASPATLVSGWNFVGLTGPSSSTMASMYPGAVDIWGWDEKAQNWAYYSPDPDDYFNEYFPEIDDIQPGHGYWVEMP